MLLGIPGDNTYANYQEATRSFWRQSVLPLVDRTAKALSGWLAPAWGEGLVLKADLDQVEALSPEREALWARLEAASFLTVDEKRAAVGYGPLQAEGGDGVVPEIGARVALKYSPEQPRVPAGNADGGQWTSGDYLGGDGVGGFAASLVRSASRRASSAVTSGRGTTIGASGPLRANSFSA